MDTTPGMTASRQFKRLLVSEQLEFICEAHNGLSAMFGKEVIVAGHLPAELGEHLSKVEELRLLADYSDGSVTNARATWAVERAEAFVAAVKQKFGL